MSSGGPQLMGKYRLYIKGGYLYEPSTWAFWLLLSWIFYFNPDIMTSSTRRGSEWETPDTALPLLQQVVSHEVAKP